MLIWPNRNTIEAMMKLSAIKPELRITVLYAIFGSLWIFISDKLETQVSGVYTFSAIQTYNRWLFVGLSVLIIYLLIQQHSSKSNLIHKRLYEREQRFYSTLENLLEGCQIISQDWYYLYLNDAAARHGKTTVNDLIGKTMMEAYPGIEQTELFGIMKRCMEERVTHRMENEFEFPDGSKGWFELNIEPVPEGLFILSQDITDRKKDELRILHLTRLYATLSQVNHMIVHAREREGLFKSICKVVVEDGKFGLSWIGLIDKEKHVVTPITTYGHASNILPLSTIPYLEEPFKNGLIGKALSTGKIVHTRDIQTDPTMIHWGKTAGAAGFHSAAVVPFHFNGEVEGILMIYATEMDFFEDEEQHNLLEELAMDVSFALETMANEEKRVKMAELLQEANTNLEAALKYEELFIANMTHEIRTPLNVILGYSGLVKEVMSDRFQGDEEEFFTSIESAGKRLMQTVDNILQFTSLQTGMAKLDHQVSNLAPIVRSIVHELIVHAEEKQIHLSVNLPEEPIFARIDQYTFGQALINLIDNAIKYTDKGEVVVNLSKRENRVDVEVRDTGIGISEEYLPKLFHAFTQEDTGYTRSYQGLGLGLSLVKNYVALNDGKIEVLSKKGEGSVFRMEFPAV